MFSTDLFKGKRILITGGGSGLGFAMASHFVELGAHVILCARRAEVLAEAADKLNHVRPQSASWKILDVRNPQQVADVVQGIWQEGPLDGLVNNAAGNFISRTEDLSPNAVDAVLGIVLHGTAYMTLEIGKRWLAEGRKGSVLSIVTTYAWTGSAYVVPSAMAKAGVLALTRSLAVEWGNRGIRLNAIAPGPFPTKGAWDRLVPREDLARAFEGQNPMGRVGDVRELTNLAAFLLADGAAYINGDCVTIDGGEWIKGAGQFNFLQDLMAPSDWDALKALKPGKNANRT